MTTQKTKLENAAEMMVLSAKERILGTNAEIVAELEQLADRAARYAAELKAHADLRPSEFAKLTPDLARLIDRHAQECNLYNAMVRIEKKIIEETAAVSS